MIHKKLKNKCYSMLCIFFFYNFDRQKDGVLSTYPVVYRLWVLNFNTPLFCVKTQYRLEERWLPELRTKLHSLMGEFMLTDQNLKHMILTWGGKGVM